MLFGSLTSQASTWAPPEVDTLKEKSLGHIFLASSNKLRIIPSNWFKAQNTKAKDNLSSWYPSILYMGWDTFKLKG